MIKQFIKPVRAAGLGVLALIAYSSAASATIHNTADEVQLLTSCGSLDNCFTSISSLDSWIWNTRTSTNPLHVIIGAGSFSGGFTCNQRSNVTYSGAGAGNTFVQSVNNNLCTNLTYENLTVQAPSSAFFAVHESGGLTVWKNVEIKSRGYAWFDEVNPTPCANRAAGQHFFFNSKIVSTDTDDTFAASNAIFNECDELWFYGSELTSIAVSPGILSTVRAFGGEVYIFGGVIKAVAGAGDYGEWLPQDEAPTAIYAALHGEVEIRGASIEVSATATAPVVTNINGIVALGDAEVDAVATSYQLSTTSGTSTRIYEDSSHTVSAPYLWEAYDPSPLACE
ncbi:MAG TPA: hypothetical protein VJU61_17335 [Polyangiaceae bacterium]|nr:hypothetical protein [Polyangiaceae bacterium]